MQSIVLAPANKKIRKQMVKRILKKGFVYHHNTLPYERDKFIILEQGFHKFYHKNIHLFKLGDDKCKERYRISDVNSKNRR